MRTVAFLFVILVLVCVYVAQNPAEAACDFQQCWVTCQRQYSINFISARCNGDSCVCTFRT
uniref:Termicin-like protein n=1 Tax=Eupolyphaga sinensis TaxID=367774 RepID=A0A0M3STY1_9NEOP|nr:termicin-like protein [Eupolyphaga sinensis]